MAKKKRKAPTCETCDNCIAIGEGDHICYEVKSDDGNPAVVVISDYLPTKDYLKCGGKKYVEG